MEINDLRCQINQIDNSIVELFAKRMAVSAQIAEYKSIHQLPITDPIREQQVLIKVSEQSGPEIADYAQKLYMKIFELSRDYQSKLY